MNGSKLHTFYRKSDWQTPRAVLRFNEEFGIETADVCRMPARLTSNASEHTAPVLMGEDVGRLQADLTPAELLSRLSNDDHVVQISKRSIARLLCHFLVCEDPQKRFDIREVSTLAHQVSLVRHVLDHESLQRVLIADEVGLGKTVEAGLLIQELLERNSNLRVIYFAPARLVPNVRNEFDRLGLGFRQWSSQNADARLDDPRLIVSIHRAVHASHRDSFINGPNWDVIVVDECHHLSDWAPGGGDPKEKFRLIRDMVRRLPSTGRLILLSGTPHQGHVYRFENLLNLLRKSDEPEDALAGRVIYRTKDDILDWNGQYLFPRRQVNEPLVVDSGETYRSWIGNIHRHFSLPVSDGTAEPTAKQRAAGWRCAQAMQWAASSPQAGLGYLVRQAIRSGGSLQDEVLKQCLAILRPYRNGAVDEPIEGLFLRISREVDRQRASEDVEDIEINIEEVDDQSLLSLYELIQEGLTILSNNSNFKWDFIRSNVIDKSNREKIVFFAQPIETVMAFVGYLKATFNEDVSIIIGGQTDDERRIQVEKFLKPDGCRFLVSSKAGGEGINLQVARRLVHIDVPWNPMDMEQRVGRVHRFGSRDNVIVDTIVVKHSREEHAYRTARQKLELIASTMVDPDRFENVFSRVMSLMPPEELQHLLIAGDRGPLSPQNETDLGRMVREGYEKWQEFDQRYSQQQKEIQRLNPGLASWEDVSTFLQEFGRAKIEDGFCRERFQVVDGRAESFKIESHVLRLPDDSLVACQDLGGLPAFGPRDEVAKQFGLNHQLAMSLFAKYAFESDNTGVAFLRWNDELRSLGTGDRLSIMAFLKLTFRSDETRGYMDYSNSLHFYTVKSDGSYCELSNEQTRNFISGVMQATVRNKGPSNDTSVRNYMKTEGEISMRLRVPNHQELQEKKRHAVVALFLAIIED